MTFFLLLFLTLLYISLSKYKYCISAKRYIYIASTLLILLSGLRHEGVGNDTYAYMLSFDHSSSITWSEVFEDFFRRYLFPMDDGEKDPGMLFFVKLLHTLHIDSRLYLFVVAAFLITPIGVFTYKYSQNLKTVLFSYCFYVTLFYGYLPNSALRQSMALAFVLWSYLLLRERKILISLLLIICGSLFHKSALVAMVLLPFLYCKNVRTIYYLSIIPFFVILIFPAEVGQFLLDDNEIYGGYFSSTYFSALKQDRPFVVILLMTVLYGIGFLHKKESPHRILFYGCALTFILTPLIWANPTALRVISYFAPCMGVLVGSVLSEKKYKLYMYVIMMAFFLQSIRAIGNYRFMWQDMELHERYAKHVHKKNNNEINYG